MTDSPPECDESARLEALFRYEILDTPAEQSFDDFTQLAAQICESPISLICLVDADRQWFKSKMGIDFNETSREHAFCAHAIANPQEVFLVQNAPEDKRFADNAMIARDPQICFYAGAPLVTPEGHALGTLCVLDRQPRTLDEKQIEALRILSRQVMSQLEARRNLRLLKETAVDLENERHEMQLILDHVPAYIIFKDTKNTILRVNRAVTEALDLESSSIEGRAVKEIFPVNAEEFYRDDLEIIRTGQPKLGEIQRVATGNTDWRWSKTDVVPITNDHGQVERLLVLAIDITDLKRTEESLRESEALLSQANAQLKARVQQQTTELRDSQARYEDLYQNAPDMFISVDPENGCIVQVNQTLLAELGYAREEVVGQAITKLFHPSSMGEEKIVIPQFRAQGYVRDRELTLARKDGTPIFVSMNTSAIRDDQGKIVASRSVFRDITEQKRIGEEAKKHLDQLAHLSRVATMNEMATGIAHELNQPLHAIKNYAQGALIRLRKRSFDTATLVPVFEDIVSDADRAAELILSLRRYVKPSEKNAARVDPTELIAHVVKILTREIKQHGATLSVNAVEELPSIMCDAVQIEQVLINLILNAVEAVSDMVNRVITVHVEPTQRQTVQFSVVDQGVGLTEVELNGMFDTFYTKKASGMGMGLAICRTIVEAHGGLLTAKANQGPGLTLSFELPAVFD